MRLFYSQKLVNTIQKNYTNDGVGIQCSLYVQDRHKIILKLDSEAYSHLVSLRDDKNLDNSRNKWSVLINVKLASKGYAIFHFCLWY